jgi:hypothetical protein
MAVSKTSTHPVDPQFPESIILAALAAEDQRFDQDQWSEDEPLRADYSGAFAELEGIDGILADIRSMSIDVAKLDLAAIAARCFLAGRESVRLERQVRRSAHA